MFMENLIYLEEVDSTNTYVKKRLGELEDRTVVYTSRQTHGRGRMEHTWFYTGTENIYMTICLKPQGIFYQKINNLTQYMCVVLCRLLEKYNIKPEIKWPNDILIDGKKIAGILAETKFQGGKCSGVALGVGININSTEKELLTVLKPATSLNLLLGRSINRDDFLKELTDEFFKHYDDFLTIGFELIRDEYLEHTNFIGKRIVLNDEGLVIAGVAEGISDDGELILNSEGIVHKYYTGEVLKS